MREHCDICNKIITEDKVEIEATNHRRFMPINQKFKGFICSGCANKPINELKFN